MLNYNEVIHNVVRPHQNFAHNTIFLSLDIDSRLIRFLAVEDMYERPFLFNGRKMHYPARVKAANSLFPEVRLPGQTIRLLSFSMDAIPPSVMVGDIAGIWKLVMADRTVELCSTVVICQS